MAINKDSSSDYYKLSRLNDFNSQKSKFEGFFTLESSVLWDCLLCLQNQNSILGDMFEIGVYKGLSAFLSSLHLRENERFFLIDGTDFMKEAKKNLTPILTDRGKFLFKMSYELTPDLFSGLRHQCRWIHIDGEHTGRAVINDLEFTENLLSNEGILILDDFFNPMYPQLTEVAFSYLSANKHKLSMFLCGWNKAYLARPLFAYHYREFIRNFLASELHLRGVHNFMITKTSTLDESTSFGISNRFVDRDYYGLDSNPDFLP